MVKCLQCGTDLGPAENVCPLCKTPRQNAANNVDTRYLEGAIQTVSGMIDEEEKTAGEYDDLVSVLEGAGRNREAVMVRPIAADERRHKTELEIVKRDLQAIQQLKALRSSLRGP